MRHAQQSPAFARAIIFLSASILATLMNNSISAQPLPSSNGTIAITAATIYTGPTADPIRNGVILIQDGKITAVGPRASLKIPNNISILDCSRSTVTAGFWNSHVHFFERKWANAAAIPAPELTRQLQDAFTQFGFSSVFDLSSPWENTRRIRDRIDSGEIPGPRIRSTGMGLLPPNPGLPSDAVLGILGQMLLPPTEVADAAEAAAASKKLLGQGVDAIKLFASAPSKSALTESAIEAAVNEAHRASKLVFVHPNNATDILTSLGAGVDIIAHTTPRSGPWDETLLHAMHERNVALTPTLMLWQFFLRHDRLSIQDQSVNTAVGQLRAWLAIHGTVLFGTDLGAVDPDPAGEYALMSQAGMTFRQILASLTTAPAERFGESTRLGRVAPGFQADLAVLENDPAENLDALARVHYTLRDGKIIWSR